MTKAKREEKLAVETYQKEEADIAAQQHAAQQKVLKQQ